MGRFSGIAAGIGVLADKLKSERTQQQALDLLGKTEQIKLQNDPEAMFKKKLYERLSKGETDNMGNGAMGNVQIDALGNLKAVDAKSQVENLVNQEILNESQRTGKSVSNIVQGREIQKKTAEEAGKPYSVAEAGLISKAEGISPKISELISLIGDKGSGKEGVLSNIYGNILGGASRIAAFGEEGAVVNPLRRGLTVGKGREAGLLLQGIKTVLFEQGAGATLTGVEAAVLKPLLSPNLKTEAKWISDLKLAQSMLNQKAQLVSKKGEKFGNQKLQAKSGGKEMIDANGNRAIVYSDGTFDELR